VLSISPDIVSQAKLVVVAGANMAGVKIVLVQFPLAALCGSFATFAVNGADKPQRSRRTRKVAQSS
jgi:hypothetical protein